MDILNDLKDVEFHNMLLFHVKQWKQDMNNCMRNLTCLIRVVYLEKQEIEVNQPIQNSPLGRRNNRGLMWYWKKQKKR